MTPEGARGLLEAATPGPWGVEDGLGTHKQVWTAEDTFIDGDMSDADAALIAAAPDMAEQIASMHYEYAVQVERDGVWGVSEDSSWGSYSVALVRYGRTEEPARIVRRLVGEPEVAE